MILSTMGLLCGYDSYRARIDNYIEGARAEGADNVIAVTPNDIVFDCRTLIKCMFGCGDWGKGKTCPSREGALKPQEWEHMLRRYKTVLIIHSTNKKISQKASFAIEKKAYLDGDVLAFSMSDCALCKDCAGNTNEHCRLPLQARPAFHSVGINVFATVEKFELPLVPLKEKAEPQNWYSAVWLN